LYCDLAAYAEEGRSLTGASYEHWQHGPFPPTLYRVLDHLEAERRGVPVPPESEGDEVRFVAFEEPEGHQFRGHPIVEAHIAKIASMPTWKVRDASHQHPGWRLTEQGEEIPYHVAFMSRRQPTTEDLRRADEIAVELGWK
jgi:hypothetical protein